MRGHVVMAALLGCLGWAAIAASEEAAPQGSELRYVELKPTFITNFGYSDRGYLRYIKADVAVRVSSKDAETATRYHLPALRHELVLLLSSQDEATVGSVAGRDALKASALENLRALLEREEGEPFIDDLMFTNFIVQR